MMNLTVPIGAMALLVALGTILLILRELVRVFWYTTPLTFRFIVACGLAVGVVVLISRL